MEEHYKHKALYEFCDPGISFENFEKDIEKEIEFFNSILTPVNFKCAIRIYSEPARKESGFSNPAKEVDVSCCGIVVAMCPKIIYQYTKDNIPEEFVPTKVGNIVIFPRHNAIKVKIYDKPIFYIDEDRIIDGNYKGDIRRVIR